MRKVLVIGALGLLLASVAGCDPGTTVGPERAIGPLVTVPRTRAGGPQVASNGSQRLAVWRVEREFGPAGTVEAAFVAANGTAGPGFELFPFEVPAPYDSYAVSGLSVATLGPDFLVALGFHVVGRGGLDIVGFSSVLVKPDGTTRPAYEQTYNGDEACPSVGLDPSAGIDPSLASNGSSYLLAYADCDRQVRVTRLDAGGAAVGAEAQPISPAGVPATEPTAAASGNGFLVSWVSQGPTNLDILGRRVSGSGVVQGSPFVISGAAGDQSGPDSSGSPSGFLVTWNDDRSGNRDVRAARVSAAGAVQDPSGLLVAGGFGNQRDAAVAYRSGSGYDVVWTAGSATGTNIRDRLVATAGALGTTKVVNGDPGDQGAPDIDDTSTGFVAAWPEAGPPEVVHGSRIDADANAVDGGLTWSTKPADQSCSSLAAGADGHLVTWQEVRDGQADVFGQRLSPTGLPSGPPLRITSGPGDQRCPVVAFGGTNYLAVWEDLAGPDKDIRGAVVDSSGVAVGFDVAVGAGETSHPAVAFDGTHFLVVWQNDGNVSGLRFDANGHQLGLAFPVSDAPGLQADPAVAGGPHGFVVAWADQRASADPIPYATPVSSDGAVAADEGIELPGTVAINLSPYPLRGTITAAAGGDNFLVAWDEPYGVRATRLAADGAVLDPDGFGLAGQGPPGGPRQVAAVWNGTDYVVVLRDRGCIVGCFSWHSYRVRVTPSGTADPPFDLQTDEVSGRFGVAATGFKTVLSYDATRTPHHASTRLFVREIH